MRKKVVSIMLVMLGVLLLFTACFSPSKEQTPSSTTAEAAEATVSTTEETSNKDVTLTFWDYTTDEETGGNRNQKMCDTFAEEKGIKVERTVIKMEDLRNTIKAAINSGEGPDVFTYDIGPGYLGVLGKAGLAADLSDYAEKYDWENRFLPSALSNCTFDGKLYGIGNEVEVLGVFYNKKIFADNGIEVPKTYEDFLKICETFKSKGITPLILTDLDQWPGFHLESIWLNAYVGNRAVSDVLALKAGFDQPDFGKALDKIYELVKNGYTNESPNSISNDDANKLFLSGKAAMRPTGTWELNGFQNPDSGLGENCGFFFLPMINADLPQSAPGGLGGSFVVNAKSPNVDLAVEFLDYIFSGERIQWWFESSLIPAVKDVNIDNYNLSPLFRDVANAILNAPEMGYNLDVLLPTQVNEVTKNYIQELLAGKKTGEECMKLKQESFKAEVDAGNYEAIEN